MDIATIDTPAFQRAIAELCVVPGTIDELCDEPEAFGARLGLDGRQLEALRDAGIDRFRAFAEDLLLKRLTLLEKFSPALIGLLARRDDFDALLRDFANRHPSRSVSEVPHKVVRDCQWFHAYVADWGQGRGDVGPHLRSVLAFERAQAQLLADEAAAAAARVCAAENARALPPEERLAELRPRLGAHHLIVDFDCDIVELVRRVTDKRPLPDEALGPPSTLLIAREPGRRSIRYIRVNARTRWLIARCDGEHSLAELVLGFRQTWAPDLSDAAVFDGLWRLLSGMRAMDMLSFEIPGTAPN